MQGAGLLGLGFVAAVACSQRKQALTTLEATIGAAPDGTLTYLTGEPYIVRTDLIGAQAARESRRRSLVVLHHLSDFRIVDEESPLRSEWVESCDPALTRDAFRPQESLSLQAAAALLAQANKIDRSPVTGQSVAFAIHTGNAADNAQYNELRWFLNLLDGKAIEPDSGAPGYQGIQSDSPARAYPDLLEAAQSGFSVSALKYPWFAVAGNRDVLVQGNFPPNEGARAIAEGSQKALEPAPEILSQICEQPEAFLTRGTGGAIFADPGTVRRPVSPDANRRLLSRKEWVDEHFNTQPNPGPVGHGFGEANRESGSAYYSREFGNIALIALDTTNPGGYAAGSLDAPQFAWLEEELRSRSSKYIDRMGNTMVSDAEDRLIVVASHHTTEAMNNPFSSGEGTSERIRGPQLEELLHRFPNVVLHLAGHGLEHRIIPKPDPQRRSSGYWQITTPSPLEMPMQGRLVEITDNSDGTVSIFSTVYDSAAPVNPGDAVDRTPGDGSNELLLASLARYIALRDPQAKPTAAGLSASDRNAELLLASPFELPAAAHRVSRRAVLGLK